MEHPRRRRLTIQYSTNRYRDVIIHGNNLPTNIDDFKRQMRR
jgi:hypothetical protein